MASFRPSPKHWCAFAEAVADQNIFEDFLDLAFQQAYWQFANSLALMELEGSTSCAKEGFQTDTVWRALFAKYVLKALLNKKDVKVLV